VLNKHQKQISCLECELNTSQNYSVIVRLCAKA